MKIPISIIIICNIIGSLFICYLIFLNYQNMNYVKQNRDFYIYDESNEKRYIEYYPNIFLSSNDEKKLSINKFYIQ